MNRLRSLLILSIVVLTTAAVSWGAVFVSVSFGPPLLPVYVQPVCPAPGYIWVARRKTDDGEQMYTEVEKPESVILALTPLEKEGSSQLIHK